jgi:RNA polymerase sigma-70 factor (ECF subfamily)
MMDPRSIDSYREELVRFVAGRVNDETAAEDIVHDALMKAFDRRDTLEQPSRLRSWLYRITRNAITDYYRSQKPSVPVPDDLAELDSTDDAGDAALQLAACLRPLLDELPGMYRDALRLADFDGLPLREVALHLGLSLSGAKSRVQRARRMLRDVVLECCRVEVDRLGGVIDYEPRRKRDTRGCD